ncbi:TRAP transporter substrate-binding protein [Polymorphum gilvum]|uniref:TRAP dicarboxylate transporter-DctP subunit n=1 Tax=Polymorphum gilvum (strain LMG 25793 / CGMCC 1.9160 / SL003B-26A1) TaxID=991905 RepID=F2J3A1_POLGS|nr:TRAP transporter substrate-binding protein [Polymorphum gilvum]ADZ69908.1 TRAP dicarboxylate transporter-DctP subunit [Polymorphum gilvum SL003B-26A1]
MTEHDTTSGERATATGLSRRGALCLAGAALGSGLAAPTVVQAAATIEWKMVTSWQKDLPGPGVTAQRICDRIGLLSGGRMRVRLYAAGELVPALGVFDAVSSGTAQIGHSASFFWQGKMPAAVFFTAIPFGLLPQEHITWIEQGSGQALWDELYAPFGIKPVMAGNTGVQMGGWFARPVETLDDLRGLKIRMPGLGGEVLRRLGATPVSLAPGEIFPALQSGLIDATEFLGPWSDRAMGFHKVTKLYYAPGFHEPNGTGEALLNKTALEGLPEDLRAIVLEACQAENARALAESEWMNAVSLKALRTEDGVEIRFYPSAVLDAMRTTSAEVLAEFADKDPLSRKVYDSFRAALQRLAPWSDVSVRRYLIARDGG